MYIGILTLALHSSSLARRRLPPGRWPSDEGSPGRRSRLSVTLTGRRLPPSARPAPPSARPPPPPSARPAPLATGRAQPAGAGGGGRTPPSWHQLGEKRKCWLWGLKNRPPKIDASSIFAPEGAPFILEQVLKKSRRSNEYFERYSHKKHEGRAESAPPPFQCVR